MLSRVLASQVVGGYYASSFFFNCADALNEFVVPEALFDDDSVVAQLVRPENNELFALAAGARTSRVYLETQNDQRRLSLQARARVGARAVRLGTLVGRDAVQRLPPACAHRPSTLYTAPS